MRDLLSHTNSKNKQQRKMLNITRYCGLCYVWMEGNEGGVEGRGEEGRGEV